MLGRFRPAAPTDPPACAGVRGALENPPRNPHCRGMNRPLCEYLIRPDPSDPRLSERVTGLDHTGARVEFRTV